MESLQIRERAQGLVEYGLIIALVAVLAIAGLIIFGPAISSLLSKLILLQRRVDASHGKLRLCEMTPVLQSVFRTSNLDRLFTINRDLREALAAFA